MVADALHIQSQLVNQTHDIIVIGTGPVGMRFVTSFARNNSTARIAVFGNEPWLPYNRASLVSLLAGDIRNDTLHTAFDAARFPNVEFHYNNSVTQINRYAKYIVDSDDVQHTYNTLVIATGSRAFIPNIPGTHLNNVFTFRDLNDTQKLMSRTVRSRHTVVIGGGLLGLEAARAMQKFHTRVTVIEHSMWLMFRQLDKRAGSYLKRHVEALGIQVRTSERVLEICGDDKVKSVLLGNGETIECDTLVIAAGISPNLQLIRTIGLHYGKGIRVNDYMQTNDASIYAIGECAEHRKRVYGLVAPGYEQADVLAHNLNGGSAVYVGSTATAALRVLNYPVFSMGEIDLPSHSQNEIRFQNHPKNIYRKLIIKHGHLHGVVAIGAWPDANRMQAAVAKQQRIWPWQTKRFMKTGSLWLDDDACDVAAWPNSAIICHCKGVTRGDLAVAQQIPACDADRLAQATGAAKVCGSCRPLLANYISMQPKKSPGKIRRRLLVLLAVAGIGVLFTLYTQTGLNPQNHRGLYTFSLLCGIAFSVFLLREVFRVSSRD